MRVFYHNLRGKAPPAFGFLALVLQNPEISPGREVNSQVLVIVSCKPRLWIPEEILFGGFGVTISDDMLITDQDK